MKHADTTSDSQKAVEPDTTAKTTYELELERLVAKWVKILKLSSWDYEIVVGGEFVNKPEPNAEVIVNDEETEFLLRFQPLMMLDAKTNLNALVLHELGHVLLHRLLPDVQNKANRKEEERVVNTITKALVAMEEKRV